MRYCIFVAFNYFHKMILQLCLYDFQLYFLITKREENWKWFRLKKKKKKSEPTNQHGLTAAYVVGVIFMELYYNCEDITAFLKLS